jgi:hypothetical protein
VLDNSNYNILALRKIKTRMNKPIFLVLIALLLSAMSCEDFQISEKYVIEKISYLASDQLRGRATFSPEIDTAAHYIAQEFKKAGLEEFGGSIDHLQSFSRYEVRSGESELRLDGEIIEEDNYLTLLNNSSISWNNNADVILTYVGPEDDFNEEFGRFRRNDDNLLVIVDPIHAENYGRYSWYFSRPNRIAELGKGRSFVMALSDKKNITNYSFKATPAVEKRDLSNVVGMIEGERTDEYVLFSAHYDHLGIRNANEAGDSIANGANDDASGTVAVMALARYFATQPKPERSIVFVAFTAEEMGGYGSAYFKDQINPDELIAMFNIEMIGKPAVSGPNTAWITGWDKSNFGSLMKTSAEGSEYDFYPDPYPKQRLFYRSDNSRFARLGVPAHSISTTAIDVDQDYHKVTDEVATLDVSHLTNTIKAILRGSKGIISGEQTPSRIDPNSL